MNKEVVFKKNIYKLCQNEQKFINDTYFWVDLLIKTLDEIDTDELLITVDRGPDIANPKIIKRTNNSDTIDRIKKYDIYESAFVRLYSSLEDFFIELLKLINDYDNKLEEKNIINFCNLDLNKQLNILNDTYKLNVSNDLWYKYKNIKSIRNLIVHNNAIITDNFLVKTNYSIKCNIGQKFSFNDTFAIYINDMKKIVGKIVYLVKVRYNLPSSQNIVDYFTER